MQYDCKFQVSDGEAFQGRSVTRYVANRLDAGELKELRLDCLQVGDKELAQVSDLLRATGHRLMDTMLALHLAENLLSESKRSFNYFIFQRTRPCLSYHSSCSTCPTSEC